MLGVRIGGTLPVSNLASASENPPSPEALLAYVDIASQRAAEGNYTEVKRLLAMANGLPANTEQNVVTYMRLLRELVLILDSLKPELDGLKDLVATGAVAQARKNSTEIEGEIDEASGRLDLLFSSLDRIGSIYHVDTRNQHHDLEVLSSTLRSFASRLAEFRDQLDAMDQRSATRLDLQAYPSPVQVEGSLDISGELQNDGIGLGGRVVTVWVNGIQKANVTLDQLGRFAWKYVVSNNSRADKLELYASYSPADEDIFRLRPSKSDTVIVPVNYRAVTLTISTYSRRVLVLENFTVQGQLSDVFGNLLPGKTVDLLVDGKPVNSNVTDVTGKYSMDMAFPGLTLAGAHQVSARFDPKQGIYAAANSENVTIQLYYLRSTLSELALSGVAVTKGQPIAISGQATLLEGRLEVDSKAYAQGLVIASLGGRELGRTLSEAGGIFRISIGLPLDLSDMNTISVVFIPARPWIAKTSTSIVVRVLNSVVVGLVAGATVFALSVFSGKSMDIGLILRRRGAPRRRLGIETVTVKTPEITGKAATASTLLSLGEFKLELQLGIKSEEPRAFIRSAYWEIRRVVAEALGVRGEHSETPREYANRVAGVLGAAAGSLSALTRLFELAEYSEHSILRSDAQEGINHAFRIAEEMNARMKG